MQVAGIRDFHFIFLSIIHNYIISKEIINVKTRALDYREFDSVEVCYARCRHSECFNQ